MKVSVCMITYNHEKFIAQAIESVMMQEAGFQYELVIGEDCSTDRTREICIECQGRFPDRIRLLLPEKNLGMMHNFVQTLNVCTGQYVALLEGDDYWTTPRKLQKQADFLDMHQDYATCFARTLVVTEDNHGEPSYIPFAPHRKDILTIEDLLRGNSIPTCSVMFRNRLFASFPDWFFSLAMGDWPLHIMNTQHGKAGYLDEPMAAYRGHSNSNWSSRSSMENLLGGVDFYRIIDVYLDFAYHKLIREMLACNYQQLAVEYFRISDRPRAIDYALKSILSLPLEAYPRRLSPRVIINGIRAIRRKT